MAAASTAARVNGSGTELPGRPHVGLVVPVRRGRVARLPGREDASAVIEVREVVHRPPRGDDVDVEGAIAFEAGVVHGLFVAAERQLGGDEQRLEPGHAAERVNEPRPMDVAPAPARGVRTHRLGASVPSGGEGVVELFRREDALMEELGERAATEQLAIGQVLGDEGLVVADGAARELVHEDFPQRGGR